MRSDASRTRSNWKIYLGIAGVVILLISLSYTAYLAQRLREGERNKALLLFDAYETISAASLDESGIEIDLELPLSIIESNEDIPIMVVSEAGEVLYARNFGPDLDTNRVFLRERLARLKRKGPEPTTITDASTRQYLYYQNSDLHELLVYFPYFQLLLLAAFVAIGFVSIKNARRAEQNRVWVGMAKETAHQLGTPISAIIGWMEHLKDSYPEEQDQTLQALKASQLDVLQEMQTDVDRLNLIADRFSKIGSSPALAPVNIVAQMHEVSNYIRRRASRRVTFESHPSPDHTILVPINAPLFNWVVENVMRNALDAMEDGSGQISWTIADKGDHVEIDIADTGKGIPATSLREVFEPGFTTKSRGWGLGLSLARRIIENYHKGKIFVKQSKVGEGTTFTIHLPKGK
jgi:signal transduction histidine kinase